MGYFNFRILNLKIPWLSYNYNLTLFVYTCTIWVYRHVGVRDWPHLPLSIPEQSFEVILQYYFLRERIWMWLKCNNYSSNQQQIYKCILLRHLNKRIWFSGTSNWNFHLNPKNSQRSCVYKYPLICCLKKFTHLLSRQWCCRIVYIPQSTI